MMKFIHTLVAISMATTMVQSLSQPSITTSNKSPKSPKLEPYGTAEVDYSAANEYLDEQYEDKIPNPYFPGEQVREAKKKSKLNNTCPDVSLM
jgi:hypothetical protein